MSSQQIKFDELMEAAKKDAQMVTSDGTPVGRLADGVTVRPLVTHADERGTVCEMYDPRWNWHPDPLVFCYHFTMRPGVVKGWNLHAKHEDRYCLIKGEMKLVFYDTRPGSPTFGEISEIVLSERNRQLVNVPINVWHADQNIGSDDVLVVNFPTIQYDHANPDKFRLPIDTPLIPYRFENAFGW
ncbi:MAG: dTDP-4-dehydrorhamnose 3,5-epimerase family protein [Pseudomonadota bacterium]